MHLPLCHHGQIDWAVSFSLKDLLYIFQNSRLSFAVDDGKGKPEFVGETECTYFFEWQTKYACLEHPAKTTCTLTNDKHQRFDLSPLVRATGDNWQALDGRHEHEAQDHGLYFMNICADIRKESPATADCPAGSAACFLSGKYSVHFACLRYLSGNMQ